MKNFCQFLFWQYQIYVPTKTTLNFPLIFFLCLLSVKKYGLWLQNFSKTVIFFKCSHLNRRLPILPGPWNFPLNRPAVPPFDYQNKGILCYLRNARSPGPRHGSSWHTWRRRRRWVAAGCEPVRRHAAVPGWRRAAWRATWVPPSPAATASPPGRTAASAPGTPRTLSTAGRTCITHISSKSWS